MLFAAEQITSDLLRERGPGVGALVFIGLFALASGVKAVHQGRGVAGFLLAASGAEIGLGYVDVFRLRCLQ